MFGPSLMDITVHLANSTTTNRYGITYLHGPGEIASVYSNDCAFIMRRLNTYDS